MRGLKSLTFVLVLLCLILSLAAADSAGFDEVINGFKRNIQTIQNIKTLEESCKTISVSTQKKASTGTISSLKKAEQVLSECQNILSVINLYSKSGDIGIGAIISISGVTVPIAVMNTYAQLKSTYESCTVDNRFYQNSMFTPNNVYPSANGLWLTNVNSVYYVANSTYQYWAPTIMKDVTQRDPLFDEIIRPTICADARVVYKADYNRLVESSEVKQNARNLVSEHIIKNIMPQVEKVLQSKTKELTKLLSEVNAFHDATNASIAISRSKLGDYGVIIPDNRINDNGFILGLGNNYRSLLDGYYQKYVRSTKKGEIFEGMYYLALLSSTDVGGIRKEKHKRFGKILSKNKKEIIRNMHSSGRIEEGPLESYYTHPLTNQESLLYAGLYAPDHISEFRHSDNASGLLPKAVISLVAWEKLLARSKSGLLSVSELRKVIKADSDIIENLYLPQKNIQAVHKQSTDYYEIAGIAAGDYLLLHNGSKYGYYTLEFPITEAWGLKQYEIRIIEVSKIDANATVNVRLKKL